MIWNELTQTQKDSIYDEYKQIKYNIKKLNSQKANKAKTVVFTEQEEKDYKNEIEELQKQYDSICIDYKCDYCGKIVKLSLRQMKQLFEGNTKPVFCSRNCSGIYYAYKSHKNRLKKQQERKDKISKSTKDTLGNEEINTIRCTYCNKEFEPSKYQQRKIKEGKQVFCSSACNNNFRFNKQEINEDIINKIKDLMENSTLTYVEIQKQSGLSQTKFKECLDKYNLGRSKEENDRIRIEKSKQTVLEKYGVDNAAKAPEIGNKIKIALNNKTKEEWKKIRDKVKQTNLERYGDKNYNNKEQTKRTNLERYGVETQWER